MNARILIALFLLAVFALGAVVLVARAREEDDPVVGSVSSFEGAVMPEGLKAPDFALRNQDGERDLDARLPGPTGDRDLPLHHL